MEKNENKKDDLYISLDKELVMFLYTVFRTAYDSTFFDWVNDNDPDVIDDVLAFRDRIKVWIDYLSRY